MLELVHRPLEVGHLLVLGVDTQRPLTFGESHVGRGVTKTEMNKRMQKL